MGRFVPSCCFREKCTFWLSLEVVKIWIWILPFYLSGLKRDEAAFKHFIDKWELLHGQVYKSFSMSSEVKGKILPNPTPLYLPLRSTDLSLWRHLAHKGGNLREVSLNISFDGHRW